MSAESEMVPSGKTETTVRRFDKDGRLIEENTTVITHMQPKDDESLPVGQYL